jgi:hypothetical protein
MNLSTATDDRAGQDERRALQVGVALASAKDRAEARVGRPAQPLLGAEDACEEARLEAKPAAVVGAEAVAVAEANPGSGVGRIGAAPEGIGADRELLAAGGRVDRETRPPDRHVDRPDAKLDPAEDVGDRVGDHPHLCGFGIDVEGSADHDRAEVVWTGERRGDEDEADGAPL